MRRVRPGPEHDALIQRMRERLAADEASLNRAPFPILGLAPPVPGAVGLGSFETVNGLVASIALRYGGQRPFPDPVVTVCTAPASADRTTSVADVLRDLMLEDASALESSPAGGDARAAEVFIDGEPWLASTIESGQSWAAVIEPDVDEVALLVTVAGRDWPLSGIALTRVDDLEPFFAGRRERVEAALARANSQPGPEDWDLPPASGLDGHRALADMMIAITRQRMASDFPAERSPLASNYAQRWEIATRAQMELAGQGRDEAEDQLHSMINHLCQLAEAATWFADQDLAERATAETLDYVGYARDVPSAEAQRAWSRYWGLHGQDPPAFESLSSAKESWLAAWQHWLDRR